MSKAPASVGKLRFKWQKPKPSDLGHIEIVDETIKFTDQDNKVTVINRSDVSYVKTLFSTIIVQLKSGNSFKFNYLTYEPSAVTFLTQTGMYFAGFRALKFIQESKLKEHVDELLQGGFPFKKTKFMSFDVEFVSRGALIALIGGAGWIFSMLVLFLAPIAAYGNLTGANADTMPRSMGELIVEIGLFILIAAHYWFYLASGYTPKHRSIRLYVPFVLFVVTLVIIGLAGQ